jgi:acetylornithine deacetylase/succinyl-diaminopimelate desuccinylase-like protein
MKNRFVIFALQALVLGALVVGLFVHPPDPRTNDSVPHADRLEPMLASISADSMLETVRFLANQGSRRFTTEGARATVDFITHRLETLGYTVDHHHVPARDADGRRVDVTNLVADLGGRGPGRSSLIFCAHYDSRGEDGEDFAPGADDNASGVSVLLEAARVFAEAGVSVRATLAFFGGEEDSLIGSRGFANDVSTEGLSVRGVINVDMVGYDEYGPPDVVIFTNQQSIPLALEVADIARRTTRLDVDTTITASGNSDHASFWQVGQPAVSIWEGYDHNPYHCTTRDTPAVLTRPFLVEITRLVISTAVHLGGAADHRPSTGPARTSTDEQRK